VAAAEVTADHAGATEAEVTATEVAEAVEDEAMAAEDAATAVKAADTAVTSGLYIQFLKPAPLSFFCNVFWRRHPRRPL